MKRKPSPTAVATAQKIDLEPRRCGTSESNSFDETLSTARNAEAQNAPSKTNAQIR